MWIAIAVVLLGVVEFVVLRAFYQRQASRILPPPVVTAVEHERADRARVDSQLIAASLEAVAAQQRQAEANARADAIQRASVKLGMFADSLAHRAANATSLADSAALYRQAYLVRTDERDSLQYALVEERKARAYSEERAQALTHVAGIADSARQRADSVLDAVVHAVHEAECRVPLTLGLVRCMSRTKAAIVGVAVGVGGTLAVEAIRDGRLKIPLRLP